jgi:hypothetical protein
MTDTQKQRALVEDARGPACALPISRLDDPPRARVEQGTSERDVNEIPVSWPFRIFLDSNALQALHEHGGSVFDGEPFDPAGARSGADAADVDALSNIFSPGLPRCLRVRALGQLDRGGRGGARLALPALGVRRARLLGDLPHRGWPGAGLGSARRPAPRWPRVRLSERAGSPPRARRTPAGVRHLPHDRAGVAAQRRPSPSPDWPAARRPLELWARIRPALSAA